MKNKKAIHNIKQEAYELMSLSIYTENEYKTEFVQGVNSLLDVINWCDITITELTPDSEKYDPATGDYLPVKTKYSDPDYSRISGMNELQTLKYIKSCIHNLIGEFKLSKELHKEELDVFNLNYEYINLSLNNIWVNLKESYKYFETKYETLKEQ